MATSLFRIRRAAADDSKDLYRVCLLTGNEGYDGSSLYEDDPDALGRIYTQPYLELSPEFCFVLHDDDGVVGYTLAALDSAEFYGRYESEYAPRVRAEFPLPEGDEASWTPSQRVHANYHRDKPFLPPSFADLYPSHLHIDLIERAQGRGNGRRMMERQLEALRAAGSRGVHLGMATSNMRAYQFYKKLGFIELCRNDGIYLGLRFEEAVPKPLPPFRCGVIEGFYGRPWASFQKQELFGNMGKWGMNLFMYGPKDDKKHRAAWRVLYSAGELATIAEEARACQAAGVDFIYALAPGLDATYSAEEEARRVADKLLQVFRAAGVRRFALLFDDIADELGEADAKAFGTPAHAQCALANAAFLAVRDEIMKADGVERFDSGGCRFLFCPTEYCSVLARPNLAESTYLATIGQQLLSEASVLWTGPAVVPERIDCEHLAEVGRILQRRPLIWDNLHANDYDNGRRVYMGPYAGRDVKIGGLVEAVLSNPNCEFEANFVPLRTLALFGDAVRDDTAYDSREAFNQATEEWLPRFRISGVGAVGAGGAGGEADPATVFCLEDVRLLADLFYLPYQHGDLAVALLRAIDDVLPAVAAAPAPGGDDAALKERCDALTAVGERVGAMFTRLTELDNRELCYSLYRFAWDVKEETELILSYVKWALDNAAPAAGDGMVSPYHFPFCYRGGITADLQQRLAFGSDRKFRLRKGK